ncbi:hypothetical protein [Streptomyces sp. NPDC091212]|uniref:hypothetical protein n=1 Tax=Streptomyces sp. NPDC091212 TaxID=3155191 RepID=UPI003440A58A
MSNFLTSRHRRIAAAASVDKAVLYTVISSGMVLARRYLTGRGVDQQFADQYGSPFGRTAAKIYRSEFGAEPRKAWSNVSGKWRRVNGFLPSETAVLDKAFTTYKRTAEYVPAAPAEAAVVEQSEGSFNVFVEDGRRTVISLRCAYEASAVVNHYLDAGYRVSSDLWGAYIPDAMVTPQLVAGGVVAPGPVEVYVKATAGYAARFEGLTGDTLRAIEESEREGTTAADDHVRCVLLPLLANWKRHLDRFEATVTDADEQAVQGLPETDPRRIAWRTANTGVDAYLKAREATRAAYVDWSFDLTGTVDIPESPQPAPVVIEPGCRVPNCEGRGHRDDDETECSTVLAEMPLGEGGSLNADLVALGDEKPYVAVFSFEIQSNETHTRTSDPAELHRLADRFYGFAGQLDAAAHVLTQLTV